MKARFGRPDFIGFLRRQMGLRRKRFQVTNFGGGTFAYLLKDEAADGEPPHRVCATCYEDGRKSILQLAIAVAAKIITAVFAVIRSRP